MAHPNASVIRLNGGSKRNFATFGPDDDLYESARASEFDNDVVIVPSAPSGPVGKDPWQTGIENSTAW